MTGIDEKLRLSSLYLTLLTDIECLGNVNFPPEVKMAMVRLVGQAVGDAVMVWVARCRVCDRPVDMTCDACLEK